jgi:hypothetical protein
VEPVEISGFTELDEDLGGIADTVELPFSKARLNCLVP